jgi:hypothetical protein
MACKKMKTGHAPKKDRNVLVIQIDQLQIARGLFQTRRGGAHRNARRPTRAQSRRELARRVSE